MNLFSKLKRLLKRSEKLSKIINEVIIKNEELEKNFKKMIQPVEVKNGNI